VRPGAPRVSFFDAFSDGFLGEQTAIDTKPGDRIPVGRSERIPDARPGGLLVDRGFPADRGRPRSCDVKRLIDALRYRKKVRSKRVRKCHSEKSNEFGPLQPLNRQVSETPFVPSESPTSREWP